MQKIIVSYLPRHRFFILLLSCIGSFSTYYCFDIPAMIKPQLTEIVEKSHPGLSETFFNMLYSTYSLPNILMPIITGVLIDQMGYNTLIIVFCGLVFLGNFIAYLGTVVESVFFIFIGRLVAGFGGESLNVSMSSLLVVWFKGKELSFSQALNLSFVRLGGVLNCFLSPRVAQRGKTFPFGLGTIICLISLVATVLLSIIDRASGIAPPKPKSDDKSKYSPFVNAKNSVISILDQVNKFKPLLAYTIITTTIFYLTYLPFNVVAGGFLLENWRKNSSMSQGEKMAQIGSLLSVQLIISSIFFPVIGYYSDKQGKRVNLLMLGSFSIFLTYFLIFKIPPLIPGILLGFGYGVFGSIVWPMMALLSPQKLLGTVLGVVTMSINLTMTIYPVFLAYLAQTTSSYVPGMYSLLILAVISMIGVLGIRFYDTQNKVSLNSPDQAAITAMIEQEYQPVGKDVESNQLELSRLE